MVVVGYGMRTGAQLASLALKAAGFSCSKTTAGSWFQSLTVLTANDSSGLYELESMNTSIETIFILQFQGPHLSEFCSVADVSWVSDCLTVPDSF